MFICVYLGGVEKISNDFNPTPLEGPKILAPFLVHFLLISPKFWILIDFHWLSRFCIILVNEAVQSYNRLVLALKQANLDEDKIQKWKKGIKK